MFIRANLSFVALLTRDAFMAAMKALIKLYIEWKSSSSAESGNRQ